jgi:mRNA-degrading endonuclease toxin of MazEF toxin-antitoxin module
MRRGTICWVNLEPVSPPEVGKTRPALILSNSDQNLFLQSVVVVPMSSQPGEIWPLRLRLEMPRGKVSFAVLPGIRQVSKERIQEVIGIARPGDVDRITEALFCYLSD